MSTAIPERKPATSVHVERTCDCPFSIAEEYAVQYLKQAEAGGSSAILHVFPAIARRVSMSFGLAIDVLESGRQHNEIHLRWESGSPLFPDFCGTVRFRIARAQTVVIVDGSFEAPSGRFGALFDRIAGRWIAERTLDDLVRRVSRYLEQKEDEWRAAHERTRV